MKIERQFIPRAKLEDFATQNGLVMLVKERNLIQLGHLGITSRYYAYFQGAEIKEGSVLKGVFGNGATEDEAIRDYIPQISGQILVVGAMEGVRREYEVPILTD